ncbi:CotH kinase family protein [Streptomyces sp. NPDC093544]|uniref:CotH kinase family protein n=1 Tax=Streptomyces sp. NPDC093544 TaxID=3155200 RepID=UPI0034339EE4
MAAAPTRLVHRIPVRLRHQWKPAALLCVGLAVLLVFFGDARISPWVTSASAEDSDTITENILGTVDLYDESTSHSIQLEYDQDDFDEMIDSYVEDGSKEYIEADLTIDGTFVNSVGIRLKGNSTLRSLASGSGQQGGANRQQGGGNGGGAAGGMGGGGGAGMGGAGGGGMAGGGGGGMMNIQLSREKPEELPWLIKIDEYVEGRAYQGERQIAVRPGSNAGLPLNEAVSLALVDESDQAAQRYSFSTLKTNNRPAATRLIVENPSKEYAENTVGTDGVLYKSLSTGSFTYQGDDPTEYETDFKQLTKEGSQDLQPVIDLIKWTEDATDKEFAEELDEYVDVKSFARYVATQNLLLNFDDMSGPGKNYYLWYDLDTKKFSVLGWDYNLTFSGDATAGPDDAMGMGGAGGMRGGAAQGGDTAEPGGTQGAPEGMPSGMPSGMPQGGAQDGARQGGGGMAGGHQLKERFLELDAFDDVYHEAYQDLYEQFFGSGSALDALDGIVADAKKAGAPTAGLDTAAKTLRSTITSRTQSLAKDEVITG